jgi:anti-anti-sigma factor
MYTTTSIDIPTGPRPHPVSVEACPDGRSVRIAVAGELDGPGSRPLQRVILDVLRRHRPQDIEIDLRDVSFLDTEGITALVLSQGDARQLNCELRLLNPRGTVYQVLKIVGLLEPFGVTTEL